MLDPERGPACVVVSNVFIPCYCLRYSCGFLISSSKSQLGVCGIFAVTANFICSGRNMIIAKCCFFFACLSFNSFLNFIVLFFSEVFYCGCCLYFSLFFFVAVHSMGCCLQPLIVITCSFSVWWAVVHYRVQLHTDTALRWISEPKFDACKMFACKWDVNMAFVGVHCWPVRCSQWVNSRQTDCHKAEQGLHFTQAWALSWNSWNFKSCPEIYSMSWIFCRCPEIFEHILLNGNGRPCPCEPQTQLWTMKVEGLVRTVTLLKVRNKQYTYVIGFG